jgi:DNA-binding response OmpR family regulator
MTPHTAKKKILVADDEEDVLELVSRNLLAAGFKVLKADNGRDALTQARDAHPALIVLDLMLPGISGLDVCKSLRADPATK